MLVEEIVGYGEGGTVVPVNRAVELIGTGFSDEADLRAGGASGIGVRETGNDAKLPDRILCLAKDTSEGEAINLTIVVYAIQRDVALIGTATVDGATTAVLHGRIAGRRQIEDARLEGENIGHITRLTGERLDGRVVR